MNLEAFIIRRHLRATKEAPPIGGLVLPAPSQAFGLYVGEVFKRGLLDAAKDLLFVASAVAREIATNYRRQVQKPWV
jgi:hypothetical protein